MNPVLIHPVCQNGQKRKNANHFVSWLLRNNQIKIENLAGLRVDHKFGLKLKQQTINTFKEPLKFSSIVNISLSGSLTQEFCMWLALRQTLFLPPYETYFEDGAQHYVADTQFSVDGQSKGSENFWQIDFCKSKFFILLFSS